MTTELEPTWTPQEITAIREGLVQAAERLRAEITILSSASALAASASTLEILPDDLDIASQRAELVQDAVQLENTRAILEQTEHVLARLDLGLYGTCERCSAAIARARLEAFPRATLCMTCVA